MIQVDIEIHGGKQGLYFEVHGEAAGFVQYDEPRVQEVITRRSCSIWGPEVVTYKGERYRVRGGIRGPLFITLGREIKRRNKHNA